MKELNNEIARILDKECPMNRLREIANTVKISDENISSINEAINYLEMHEAEIRGVRQLLMLKVKDYWVKEFVLKHRQGS